MGRSLNRGSSLLLIMLFAPLALMAQNPNAQKIAQGKYLVENVAICADCHTPRTQRGGVDRTKWLQGATLDFKSVSGSPDWALQSTDIAGLPGWKDADAVKFFETGVNPSGIRARPPMPQFRFSTADAEAIVAYLRSVRPATR